MEQKRYKILLFKLSVVAIGMVAMVVAGVSIGQNMLFEKTPVATEFSQSSDQSLTFTFNRNFDIIDEAAIGAMDPSMEKSLKMLANINSLKVEAFAQAIEDIAVQPEIPDNIKQNMIARLEIQLDKSATKLHQLEKNILTFSFSRDLPQSRYFPKNNTGSCDKDQQAVPEQCDGKCDSAEGTKQAPQSGKDSKRPVETFYWI